MDKINKFNKFLKENLTNKGSETSTRLVEVEYNGEKMTAVAIGFASGPYFKEFYYILDDIQYDNKDFDKVIEIDPMDIITRDLN